MEIKLQDLLATVRKFVETHKGLDPSALEVETQLFQEGYLDSFSMVELISELERLLPDQLNPGDLIPDDFATVRTLEQRLLEL